MLIHEQLKQDIFSDAERTIIDYMKNHPQQIETMTATALAQKSHTNRTSVTRIAQKLGFKGWRDFKIAYLKEQFYRSSYFQEVDANRPFEAQDSLGTIAGNMAQLYQDSVAETHSLLDPDQLQAIQQSLLSARTIKVFASHSNAIIARDFAVKMRNIHLDVDIVDLYQYGRVEALNSDFRTCAIFISYTGENSELLKNAEILCQKNATIISLTSIGNNSLTQISEHKLSITTREKLYSKIGSFTTNVAILYLLDVLYSLCFSKNYKHNMDEIIRRGQKFDNRQSSLNIIQEN